MSFFKLENVSRTYLIFAFLIKIGFAFIIWAIYTYYYTDRSTSDIFKYFDDASIMYYDIFKVDPKAFLKIILGIDSSSPELKAYTNNLAFWDKNFNYGMFNDNRTIIRFNAIVYLFSFGYYHIHAFTMCFVSFAGLTALYKTFQNSFESKSKALFIAVFLIPSVMFWGSGVLKEGLLIFGIGFLLYFFNESLTRKVHAKGVLWIAISIALLSVTKMYVMLAIIPGLIALWIIRLTGTSFMLWKFISVHVIVIGIGLSFKHIKSTDTLIILQYKQKDFIQVAQDTKAGSTIDINILEPTLFSFVRNAPQGLINGLFRPHLFDSKSPIVLIAALENLLIIGLMLLAIFFFKKPPKQNYPLLYFAIFYVVLLATLIGLIVPVLGAIVRYKVPLLPFLAIILLQFIDHEKLLKRFPILQFRK